MTAISATNLNNYAVTDYNTTQAEQSQSAHNAESIYHTNDQSGANAGGNSSDFATVFSNTVEEQSHNTAPAPTSAAFPPVSTSMLPGSGMMPVMDMVPLSPVPEQTMSSAVSSTDTGEQMAQVMLMMMMLMMQGGGSSQSMSMFPMMMNAMMPQMDNSSQNFNNSQHIHDPFSQNANFSPIGSQSGIEISGVGGMMTSSVVGFGSPVLPLNVGIAVTPVVTSNLLDRSPERYRAVLDQFQVETAERYRPGRDGFTYCNIFVLDVVRAMGAHIPHLGAINMCNWLGTTGRQHGWREVDPWTAQAYANMGRPAVTSAGSIGHVQMVVPSRTPFNPERGVSIAQAGRINTNYAPISTIYAGNTLQNRIRYFVHD